jgi:hypothetical protein
MSGMLTKPYFMKSERLGFPCWSKEDLPLARELWGDLEVTCFFGGPFSDEEISQRLEREITGMNTNQFQYWPIPQPGVARSGSDFARSVRIQPEDVEMVSFMS